MAIFRRTETSELPGSQVEYNNSSGARQWIMLALYILMALAVAILVVMAARWVYHKVHDTNGPNPAPVAPQVVAPAPVAPPKPAKKSPSPSSATPPSSSSHSTITNPSTIPNNGPGDVVALFVGVSLAAAGLHYAFALKRAQD
jgi:cytoskeletal protein RodZ